MPKLTKRLVDALERNGNRDVFMWDSEVRGFGVRVKPSGMKTFIIQYRNAERRTRRFVIGRAVCSQPKLRVTSPRRSWPR